MFIPIQLLSFHLTVHVLPTCKCPPRVSKAVTRFDLTVGRTLPSMTLMISPHSREIFSHSCALSGRIQRQLFLRE